MNATMTGWIAAGAFDLKAAIQAPHAQQRQPGAGYFALMTFGLLMITLTGHLGGILSGVESP